MESVAGVEDVCKCIPLCSEFKALSPRVKMEICARKITGPLLILLDLDGFATTTI